MTIAEMLASLPGEKHKEITHALMEAAIIREFKGDHRPMFRKLREKSTGRAKKIYAALAKSSKEEVERMSDRLLDVWPSQRM